MVLDKLWDLNAKQKEVPYWPLFVEITRCCKMLCFDTIDYLHMVDIVWSDMDMFLIIDGWS